MTRLLLHDGQGYLTLQPRFYSTGYVGFEVTIPAGEGAWTAPDVVPVPDLGIDCRRQSGLGLDYQCGVGPGSFDEDPGLPVGGYQVTIPVAHDGPVTGLVGQAWVDGEYGYGDVGRFGADTFPVYDAPHARSAAEVRSATLARDDLDSFRQRGEAVVPITLYVAPGEAVTAVDVPLPATTWRLTGTNAPALGLQCRLRPAVPLLHCGPAGSATVLPGGRYSLVVDLHYDNTTPEADPGQHVGTVALTVGSDASVTVDGFSWLYPPYYP